MKKILITANVSKEHIRKFHIPFILRLKELGWQVDVACRLDEPIPECDTAYDLPCDRNPFRGGILKSVKQLRQIIREGGYKTVICNTVTGSMITRLAAKPLRKKGVKVFYLNHGLHFFPGASPLRWISGYPMEKLLSPHTDVMVTINSTDCQTAKKYLGVPVIEQIHGIGVNLRRFTDYTLSPQEKLELRQTLGLAPEDFLLTYVAEIIENKNQPMLLDALEIVRKKLPNAKLLLVGPEHDDGKLRRYAAEKGLQDAVIFLGWRNDIPRLLRASDFYVASSKSEGLGLNLIEAMACGLPVVASRNRGHEEIIAHGENGYLVPMNDHEQMARLVLQLHEDGGLADRLVAKALQDIKKYEVENVLDSLTDILNRYALEEQSV